MNSRALLLEIGVEEVPARFIPGAMGQLKERIAGALVDAQMEFGKIKTYATPRRLCVLVEDVAGWQRDKVEEIFGPPRKVAFNDDGSLTKAGEGFARSQGVAPSSLSVKAKGKGEYAIANVQEPGRPSIEVLPEILKKTVLSLHFPKAMRWGDGSVRFVRPIQWILALYGSETVGFEIEGVRSGNTTRGHRFLSPGDFALTDIADYSQLLDEHHVVVDMTRRVDAILKQSAVLARTVGGTPIDDPELLEHVACIVEYPVAVLGEFPEKYLNLPDELLMAVMRGHQKYFAIAGPEGRLLNKFIVISNTTAENALTVRVGAERVIKARFEDAEFYYAEDTSRPLGHRVDDLRNVTYHEKLGTLEDKTYRLAQIAAELADRLCQGKTVKCGSAARLSKADLITGVVREFPELQGVMGKYYALHDGADAEVAEALREQYLPAFSGDRLPESDAGAVLSLADRIDSIAAFFSIGLKPTGSEDPFALRRHALSALAILLGRDYKISVNELLSCAIKAPDMEVHGGRTQTDLRIKVDENTRREILDFFKQRIEQVMLARGYANDLVQSVLPYALDDPMRRLLARLDALREFKKHKDYAAFLMAIKRVKNITKAEGPHMLGDVAADETLFRNKAESDLYAFTKSSLPIIHNSIDRNLFSEAFNTLPSSSSLINSFFSDVLVMDKDEAVKENRLSLLRGLWSVCSEVADFSKLE